MEPHSNEYSSQFAVLAFPSSRSTREIPVSGKRTFYQSNRDLSRHDASGQKHCNISRVKWRESWAGKERTTISGNLLSSCQDMDQIRKQWNQSSNIYLPKYQLIFEKNDQGHSVILKSVKFWISVVLDHYMLRCKYMFFVLWIIINFISFKIWWLLRFKNDRLVYFKTVFFLTPNYSEALLPNTFPQQIHSPQKEPAF